MFTRKPKDQYVRAVNDEVSISCDGTGQPKPNIYWRKVSNIVFLKSELKVSNETNQRFKTIAIHQK